MFVRVKTYIHTNICKELCSPEVACTFDKVQTICMHPSMYMSVVLPVVISRHMTVFDQRDASGKV